MSRRVWGLRRYLVRPLKTLVAGAEAIGARDTEHRIKLSGKTELRLLADTLNESRKRLPKTVGRLERQRDDFQTLYRLVDQLNRGVLPEERRQRAVELAGKILNTECLIVRPVPDLGVPGSSGIVTFHQGLEVIEGPVSENGEAPDAPAFYSTSLVDRWMRGELDGVNELKEGATVAYPLSRRGHRLGLLLRPAQQYDRGLPEPVEGPDPDMVQALTKHLSIAFEFSDLLRGLVEEKRLAAIGETVAGLSHWLKNTLNGLRAGEYVIDRAVDQKNPEKFEKGWQVMKKSVHKMEKLTSDLLFCAKERVPERESVDPNQIVRDVVDLLNEKAASQGVELVIDVDSRVGNALLDRDAVHRALLNLVTNAIDACVESESGDQVKVRTRSAGEELAFTVEDNGLGMPEAVLKPAFRSVLLNQRRQGDRSGIIRGEEDCR